MEKISQFLSARLVNERGELLGRVLELRSEGEPEHGSSANSRSVSELLYVRTGLLEKLGLREAAIRKLPWKAIKRIEGSTLVVSQS